MTSIENKKWCQPKNYIDILTTKIITDNNLKIIMLDLLELRNFHQH